MSREIKVGDRVLDTWTGLEAHVENIWPEVNIAIIRTSAGLEKSFIDDLVVLSTSEPTDAPETKKKSLLDKLRSTFLS